MGVGLRGGFAGGDSASRDWLCLWFVVVFQWIISDGI